MNFQPTHKWFIIEWIKSAASSLLTSNFEAHFHRISEALFLMTHKDEWHYKLNLSRFRTHNNTIEDGEISFEFSFDVDMRSPCLSFGWIPFSKYVYLDYLPTYFQHLNFFWCETLSLNMICKTSIRNISTAGPKNTSVWDFFSWIISIGNCILFLSKHFN